MWTKSLFFQRIFQCIRFSILKCTVIPTFSDSFLRIKFPRFQPIYPCTQIKYFKCADMTIFNANFWCAISHSYGIFQCMKPRIFIQNRKCMNIQIDIISTIIIYKLQNARIITIIVTEYLLYIYQKYPPIFICAFLCKNITIIPQPNI